eukprot:m.40306 g.40306  ORF g.40306 m.40306 type:complete len:100 (+) comp10342_c0_seq2:357-656(+)
MMSFYSLFFFFLIVELFSSSLKLAVIVSFWLSVFHIFSVTFAACRETLEHSWKRALPFPLCTSNNLHDSLQTHVAALLHTSPRNTCSDSSPPSSTWKDR